MRELAELTRREFARLERADAKLNEAYKVLLATYEEVPKEKLLKAQRA